MSGIYHNLLTRLQFIFDHMSVKLSKCNSAAGYFLHNKSLSAKKAGTQFFLKMHGQFHTGLGSKKSGFLHNHGVSRSDFKCFNGAGKTGSDGNHAAGAFCRIDILKQSVSGHGSSEYFSDTASDGFHFHIG